MVKGINGSITILGELNCDITIGDRNSPAFKEVNLLVTSAITPILIGQNILSHRTLTAYSINNRDVTIEFKCSFTSGHKTHTAPLTSPQDYTTSSKHNPMYGVQTTFSTDTMIPLPYGQTFEEKLHWLNQNTGLKLPNHSNRNKLENVTDLLLHFIVFLGTENGEKGTFIKPVQIPTANHIAKGSTRLPKL